jgi:lipid II:glycine glycyltransferase (peptidoglycan interpeptide bridge formation enzyme)
MTSATAELAPQDEFRPDGPAAQPSGGSGLNVLLDDRVGGSWDQTFQSFDDISYDQTQLFSERRWGEARMRQIVLEQDGSVVAGARVCLIVPPGLRTGLAYVRGGPVWRQPGRTQDPDLYRTAVAAIQREYAVERGHHLSITPRFNPDFVPIETEILKELGFRVLRQSTDAARYFVNLQVDADEQMSSLHPTWRRNLRKALSNPFEISESTTEDGIADFISMNRAMLKRKGFLDSGTIFLLPELCRAMPAALKPRIVIARFQGRPVAGAAIVLTGDTAHYLFGASDDSMLPLRAGFALQWWAIDWLSRAGFKWYDLGGESQSGGLAHFKRGLVGRMGRIVDANVEWEYSGSRRSRLIAETAFAARAVKRAYMRRLNG